MNNLDIEILDTGEVLQLTEQNERGMGMVRLRMRKVSPYGHHDLLLIEGLGTIGARKVSALIAWLQKKFPQQEVPR